MPWVWVLAAVLAILFVWFWSWGTTPTPIEFSEPNALARVLRVVVMRGVYKADVRGRLEISVQQSRQPALVFTKSKMGAGNFGVTATVPRAALNDNLFERLRSELTTRRVVFSDRPEKDEPCLSVEVGCDFGLALVLAQLLFQDILGGSFARDGVGYMRDVLIGNHPSLTGVDAPNEEVFK